MNEWQMTKISLKKRKEIYIVFMYLSSFIIPNQIPGEITLGWWDQAYNKLTSACFADHYDVIAYHDFIIKLHHKSLSHFWHSNHWLLLVTTLEEWFWMTNRISPMASHWVLYFYRLVFLYLIQKTLGWYSRILTNEHRSNKSSILYWVQNL